MVAAETDPSADAMEGIPARTAPAVAIWAKAERRSMFKAVLVRCYDESSEKGRE
jgi:hypothetical protein